MKPIFIAYTRSFLMGVLPLLAVGADAIVALTESGDTGPVTAALAAVTGMDQATAEGIVRIVGTLAGLLVAYERAGWARKYTLDPRDT